MSPHRAMTIALRLACALVVAGMLGTSALVDAHVQAQTADATRCTDQDLEALRRQWNIEPDVTVYDTACKAWPDDARLRLTALVYDKGDSESPGSRSGWLALALMDAKTHRIASRYRETLEEDAMIEFRAGLVTLDTARYRLAPGIRAFGVVLRLANRSRCADGVIEGAWRLFVPQGTTIRAVTNEEVYLHMWRFAEGTACREARIEAVASLTFDVKPRAGTWADLVITARRGDRKRAPLVVEVPYDGRGYRLERWRERFDRWYR